jgi:hypothetical protein
VVVVVIIVVVVAAAAVAMVGIAKENTTTMKISRKLKDDGEKNEHTPRGGGGTSITKKWATLLSSLRFNAHL